MKTSLFTALLSLLRSTKTAFWLPMSILSASTFKLVKLNFAVRLDISTPVASFKSAFVS